MLWCRWHNRLFCLLLHTDSYIVISSLNCRRWIGITLPSTCAQAKTWYSGLKIQTAGSILLDVFCNHLSESHLTSSSLLWAKDSVNLSSLKGIGRDARPVKTGAPWHWTRRSAWRRNSQGVPRVNASGCPGATEGTEGIRIFQYSLDLFFGTRLDHIG